MRAANWCITRAAQSACIAIQFVYYTSRQHQGSMHACFNTHCPLQTVLTSQGTVQPGCTAVWHALAAASGRRRRPQTEAPRRPAQQLLLKPHQQQGASSPPPGPSGRSRQARRWASTRRRGRHLTPPPGYSHHIKDVIPTVLPLCTGWKGVTVCSI